MDAAHSLITTLVASIVFAGILGYFCKSVIRISPLVGYLIAGVLLGPHTPGFAADPETAMQLAEIGIILLMFSVGLHFSIKDLISVRTVALPGALFQIAIATLLGAGYAAQVFGLGIFEAIGFGLALSVASTVVLLRALEDRGLLKSKMGHVAVGWLIVEDLVMVLAIVFMPVVAHAVALNGHFSMHEVMADAAETMLKIGAFVLLMIIGGQRILPPILRRLAATGSRELLSLGTLGIALGISYIAYTLFGASFALGAFLAGLVLNGSEIGHKAAEDSLPLRDTFAVIFFVSVGMLFNPAIVLDYPWAVLSVLAIIIVGKSLAAMAITVLFKQPWQMSKMVAASLAQIGEFSFILAGLGIYYKLLPQELYDLIIAGAIISIALNPFLFWLATRRGH